MDKERVKAIRVGVLVFTSIVLLMLFLFFMGSKDYFFNSKTQITTDFNDIQGVTIGNNVRFSGINVGKVTDINITNDSTVTLNLAIVNKYVRFIYKNSIAEISQDGVVGNKIIIISAGSAEAGKIENGSHLRSRENLDMLAMIQEMQDIIPLSKIAVNHLFSIVEKIDNGDGDIALLLNDNQLTTQVRHTVNSLNHSLTNLNSIVQKIEHGDGDMSKLLNNNSITNQIDDTFSKIGEVAEQTEKLIEELQNTIVKLNDGDGSISMLLNDAETAKNLENIILMIQNSLTEFDKTTKAIQNNWAIRGFSKKDKNNKTE